LTAGFYLDRIIMVSKKALIITDGTESIQSIAQEISGLMTGFNVDICSSQNFDGKSLLPVDTFFIGCENPSPQSFSFIEEMLSHINLASRKCGIFSNNDESIKYLRDITNDCEADVKELLLLTESELNVSFIKNWLSGVLKCL